MSILNVDTRCNLRRGLRGRGGGVHGAAGVRIVANFLAPFLAQRLQQCHLPKQAPARTRRRGSRRCRSGR